MANNIKSDYFIFLSLIKAIVSNSYKTEIGAVKGVISTRRSKETDEERFAKAVEAIFGQRYEPEKPGPEKKEGEDIKIRRMILAEYNEGRDLETKDLIRKYATEIFENDAAEGIKITSTVDRIRRKLNFYRNNYFLINEEVMIKKSDLSKKSRKKSQTENEKQIEAVLQAIGFEISSVNNAHLLEKYQLSRIDKFRNLTKQDLAEVINDWKQSGTINIDDFNAKLEEKLKNLDLENR